MFFDTKRVPTRKELLIDLAAFGATIVIAVVQDWKASDIVWASWITSLLLGLSFFLVLSLKKLWDYAFLVSPVERDKEDEACERLTGGEPDSEDRSENDCGEEEEEKKAEPSWEKPTPMEGSPGCLCLILGGSMALLAWWAGPGPVRIGLEVLMGLNILAWVISILAPRRWLGVRPQSPIVRAFVFLPTSLFLIFFFLMHFGGFHMGHAVFLGFIVPPEVEFISSADSLAILPETLVDMPNVEVTMSQVLDELLEGAAVMRGAVFSFLGLLILTYWPYILSVAMREVGVFRAALMFPSEKGHEMLLPYKNVVRVHLMIFALVPLATFESGIVMTIGVMFFFFFPVETVVGWYRGR